MERFEYKELAFFGAYEDPMDSTKPPTIKALNKLGEDGWELCGIMPSKGRIGTGHMDYKFYFKRELPHQRGTEG